MGLDFMHWQHYWVLGHRMLPEQLQCTSLLILVSSLSSLGKAIASMTHPDVAYGWWRCHLRRDHSHQDRSF